MFLCLNFSGASADYLPDVETAMDDNNSPETFEEFKNSFSYGARTDLNFKFLKSLDAEQAADFFQQLLWKLGDFLNDGDGEKIAAHIRDWQARGYSGKPAWEYDRGPLIPLPRPLDSARLTLISSTGHFVAGDDPRPFGTENMTQREAVERISEFTRSAPQLSIVPFETPIENLRVRHGGYDIRAAQADANTCFPLQILAELSASGRIGNLHNHAYSFVGAAAQMRILNEAGPQWLGQFKQEGIEAALLIPV